MGAGSPLDALARHTFSPWQPQGAANALSPLSPKSFFHYMQSGSSATNPQTPHSVELSSKFHALEAIGLGDFYDVKRFRAF